MLVLGNNGDVQPVSAIVRKEASLKRRVRSIGRFVAHIANSPTTWREELELAKLESAEPFTVGSARLAGHSFAYTHPQSLAVQYRSIFQRGCYRLPAGLQDPIIIDCGANIGVACLYWLRHFPSATIKAFEPDPAIFAVLQHNLGSYLSSRLSLVEAAVWIERGTAMFRRQGAGGGRLSTAHDEAIPVPTVRLADVLAEYISDGCDSIDLLKVDIEGAECAVLLDCAPMLRHVERLFVEYHCAADSPQELSELISTLDIAGFRLTVESEVTPGSPFVTEVANADFDMQLNVWAKRPTRG